jgi:tetratricopeptide (TPR) repeat protein
MPRQNIICAIAIVLLVHTAMPSPLQQGDVSGNKQPAADFDSLRTTGFKALYNLDYETARAKFEQMIKIDPLHPAGYFYLATNQWASILYSLRRLQIGLYSSDSFYTGSEDKVDPKIDREFRESIDKAIRLARERVNKNKNDVEGLYYLGAAYGMKAGYEASVARQFRPALRDGSRGVGYHRDIIKIDPNYADAYLSIGLYDYIVGTQNWLLRGVLGMLRIFGNRKRGLEELHKVVAKGKYASDDARIMLIALYQREDNYAEATRLLDDLAARYPMNYLFSLERAILLGKMGKREESRAAFDQLLKNERAQAVADLIHYNFGEALFRDGDFTRAEAEFAAVIRTAKAETTLVSLAHLQRGQSLDALGKHQDALTHYKIVLERQDVFDSHKLAEKYSKRPYSPSKPADRRD